MVERTSLAGEALDLIASRFRALSEPVRLRLLMALQEGERSVGELVALLETSQPNVSKHLRVLQEAGLVGRRQAGTSVFYAVSDPSVFAMCDLVCSGMRQRLESQSRALGG